MTRTAKNGPRTSRSTWLARSPSASSVTVSAGVAGAGPPGCQERPTTSRAAGRPRSWIVVAVRSVIATRASWRVEVAVRWPCGYGRPSGEGPVAMATWRWAFGVTSEMPARRTVVPWGRRLIRVPTCWSARDTAAWRAVGVRGVGTPYSSRGCFDQASERADASRTIRL
ncbi:hypothetical protein BKM31_44960 [[Actinomadura] parvosata subsp. kistnae]|uniref:Uncharacterized protein n=1 Tax=[Actinomadura] parvosata subsp. kistnae TaxID=1909395 RepID=A0A1V0ABR6_9ACTN|nr:hypothetical protein BKM31_44960 [Nonomuraea sp. ATCC 55076]